MRREDPLANHIPVQALAAIEDVVRRHPGVSAPQILRGLPSPVAPRTLQYRLRHLVTRNRLAMDGDGRWARYRVPDSTVDGMVQEEFDEPVIPFSEAGTLIQDYVRRALQARKANGKSV